MQSLSTVSGQVVQDPGGMPLKKVAVSLIPSGGGERGPYATVSDAEGHFQIDHVQPGDYFVALERNGFVSTRRRSRTYSAASFSVAAGQDVTGLLFRMLPAGVIQGKVLDEDGDALPGVEGVAAAATGQNAVSGGQTNDLGEYRISGLPGGEYVVMAQSGQPPALINLKPEEPRVYAPTFYPGTTDRRQATRIQVHPGDEVGANFSLVSTPTFSVRGSVSGLKPQNGSQPGPATVALEAVDNTMPQHFQGAILPNRTFQIAGVLPGSYRATMTANGGDGWQVLRTGQTVDVHAADVDGLQLSPEPPSQIRGRFRMDTNSQNPDWSQLNIQIDPDEREGSDGPVAGRVAKDGSFNLQAPSGNYHVLVTSNSNGEFWRDFIMKDVVLNGKEVGDSGFALTGGITSLEIVASAQGSSIEGNVVDEDGKPVADISVVCIPDASRRKRRDIYQQVTSDRQGHFAMRGLNPGEYQVFTLDDPADDITDPDFVVSHEALGQTVTLEAGERKGVVLKLPAENQP
jgi:Carboxypeptidase regulatory-like domain